MLILVGPSLFSGFVRWDLSRVSSPTSFSLCEDKALLRTLPGALRVSPLWTAGRGLLPALSETPCCSPEPLGRFFTRLVSPRLKTQAAPADPRVLPPGSSTRRRSNLRPPASVSSLDPAPSPQPCLGPLPSPGLEPMPAVHWAPPRLPSPQGPWSLGAWCLRLTHVSDILSIF